MSEEKKRLEIIYEMIEERMNNQDMLMTTFWFLIDVMKVTGCHAKEKEKKIVLSACGEFVEGGAAVVGWAVNKSGEEPRVDAKLVPSKKANQVGYDAIYESLVSFFGMINNPGIPVEVHSSHKTTVAVLNAEIGSVDETLTTKKENILELVANLPVGIKFVWKPEESTNGMKLTHDAVRDFISRAEEAENK
jgi:hypothetical protein